MVTNRPIDFWLSLLHTAVNDHFRRALEEHGLTRREWEVMNLISDDPAGPDDLEETLRPFAPVLDADSLEDDLAELVESGWLERSHDDKYKLSDRGHAAYRRLKPVFERINADITLGITSEDLATTLAVLERMAGNLGWREPRTDS